MLLWIGAIQPSRPRPLLRRSGLVLVSRLALACLPKPCGGQAIHGLSLSALAALGADI